METSTLEVKMDSLKCRRCNLHHALDENGVCEFCRHLQATKNARTDRAFNNLQVLGIVMAIMAFGWLVTELTKAVIAYSAMP